MEVSSLPRRFLETGILLVVGFLVLYVLPNSYQLHIASLIVIYALAAIGLNILIGYSGIMTVGHAAFLIIGAYGWGVATRDGLTIGSALVGIVGSLVLGALVAWGLGYLCLRFKGYHVTIATLAFGLIVWAVARNWTSVTGGNDGLSGVPGITVPGYGAPQSLMALSVVLLALFWWLQSGLRGSTMGMAMWAVRGDEATALSVGVPVRRTRVVAFVLSSIPVTVAGILLSQQTGYVHPDEFWVTTSVNLIAIPIIGGRGWRWAPIVGSFFVIGIPEYARFLDDYRLVFYGLMLMLVVIFLPDGLRALLPTRKAASVRRRRPGDEPGAGATVPTPAAAPAGSR